MSYTYQTYTTSNSGMISSSTVLAHVPMTVDTSSTGTTTISYQYNGHIYNTIYPYSSTGYNPYPTSVGSSTTYVSGLPHEMPTIYEMNFVEDEQEHKVKLAYSEPLKYKIGQWMKDNVSTPWSMHFSINPAPTGTHDSAMMTMTGQQIFSGKMSMVYSFADLATAALFRLKF